jgi:hypothetical protein
MGAFGELLLTGSVSATMAAMSAPQFTNPVFQRYWAARLRLAGAYMAVAETTKNLELRRLSRKLAATSRGFKRHTELIRACHEQAMGPVDDPGIVAAVHDAIEEYAHAADAIGRYFNQQN